MEAPKLVWGAADWLFAAGGIVALLFILLLAGYWRAGATLGTRALAFTFKIIGILILALCLLEPLFSEQRPRPGANQFLLLADNSQSMTLKDGITSKTRGQQLAALAGKDSSWLAQLGRDFDVRPFAFDSQLRAVDTLDALPYDGTASDLGASLDRLQRRFEGRPVAGIFLFTDAAATDTDAVERVLSRMNASSTHTPIYPVLLGSRSKVSDISVEKIAVTQTNFEDAPVTLTAEITAVNETGRTIVVELLDESGKSLETRKINVTREGDPLAARFKVKPDHPGISFYRIKAAAEGQTERQTDEATLANNTRMVAVDRGHGPYRILYVAGRLNWEFKFLQRALAVDDQVQLASLLRVARREPKFNFMGLPGDPANPLYRGFQNRDEQVEQFDQPVFIRFGVTDDAELKGGFPKGAEELFRYNAIILDRVEAEFFTQDQMQLLKDFVRQRGGGLLMLGGNEAFKNGKYDNTPIGDLLPIYCDQVPTYPEDAKYRLTLTREGWLEPWLRLRGDESSERQRLDAMPQFQTLNAIRGIKPGATILARAAVNDGEQVPALVEQHFGKGRTAALLVGDLWKWELHRPVDTDTDMEKAWRQTIRWLVADVPQRVDIAIDNRYDPADADGSLRLVINARDTSYAPLDNATVTLHITPPDGKSVELRADAVERTAGRYEAVYLSRQPGAYRAHVTVVGPDGTDVGQTDAGWTSDPAAEEFRTLQPDLALLDRIAHATGGQIVKAADLDTFASTLATKNVPITEPYVRPFWHQSWVFLLALAFLAAEWGLRRWKGLP